jgi:hypothetical protein
MGLLLYSSNEMFSSTELIRKSKLIFDKILSNEIEKAIILRDGKPSFLLMEFTKYEKIMAEYEQLKRYVQKQKAKQQKAKTIKTPDIPLAQEEQQQDIIQKIEEETQEVETTQETKEVQEEIEKTKEVQKTQEIQEETKPQTKELTQEEEIQEAFKNIEHLNFDEKMKKIAQDKIRQKIILARQERERQKEQERLEQEEQERIEQEKLQQIQEETQKKQQELQEFWD